MNQEELKQRLIEFLEQCSCPYSPPCTSECYECNKVEMYDKEIENIADHLIANGVTIRERGEWTGMDGDICSRCGRPLSDIFDADSYYAIGFDIKEIVACPFCGADMRGVKDE